MRPFVRFVAFIVLLIACQDAWGQSGLYVVTGNDVLVRSGPGTSYSKMDARNKGETVTVLALYDDNWAKISLPDGRIGYMSRKYLSYSGEADQDGIRDGKDSLRERLGGMKMDDRGKFWLFVGLAVLLFYLSLSFSDKSFILAVVLNLLSAGALFVWTRTCRECFWYLDLNRHGLLLWLLFYALTIAGYTFIGATALKYLKSLREVFHDFFRVSSTSRWVLYGGPFSFAWWGSFLKSIQSSAS